MHKLLKALTLVEPCGMHCYCRRIAPTLPNIKHSHSRLSPVECTVIVTDLFCYYSSPVRQYIFGHLLSTSIQRYTKLYTKSCQGHDSYCSDTMTIALQSLSPPVFIDTSYYYPVQKGWVENTQIQIMPTLSLLQSYYQVSQRIANAYPTLGWKSPMSNCY